MFDGPGIAVIGKAARQAVQQAQALVQLGKQQPPGVGIVVPAVETGRYLAAGQR